MASVQTGIASPRDQLVQWLNSANPYDFSPAEMGPLQLDVARQMFAEMRPRIPVLDRRASAGGIDRINAVGDLVPLLLSHTTYKTYPQSFVTNGQWDCLAKWLGVVSMGEFEKVDVAGTADIDEFLDRMWAAGYRITTSSGTGGKVSLLPKSGHDFHYYRNFVRRFGGEWPNCIEADQSRHFFLFGPVKGAVMGVISGATRVEYFGRPDSRHVLVEEPLRIARVSRMAEMREKMKAGAATPEEIRDIKEEGAQQAARSAARFEEMVELLVALRAEPVYIMAGAAQLYDLVERLRARGVSAGQFHPRSVINYGGGTKHFKLPDDWERQILDFFGDVINSKAYGMTEMTWSCVYCPAGNYHIPPTLIPLVLDEAGEKLVEPQQGLVTGRLGFLDLMTGIRWGGTVSGDKVTIDLDGECPCGHRSPNVRAVGRYIDLQGDDKIQCAGTIDAYIRGAISG